MDFAFFPDHDPRVLGPVLADDTCAKIILNRNPADSYVSLAIARRTDQWKLGDIRSRKTARVRFDEGGVPAPPDPADRISAWRSDGAATERPDGLSSGL
jgi:hypothetical protein